MSSAIPSETLRLRIAIRGAVQGVGFRPFIYRLANELALTGWVNNSAQGVFLELEGPRPELEKFLFRLEREKPPRSFIQSLESAWLDPAGYTQFEIRESQHSGEISAVVLPDIATCPDCLREIFDPANRRYAYPFTNCTNCGPRFSIIQALPYDRVNTSMKQFTMCPQCQAEYENPLDRRFHAQPNACPVCGPHLELWDRQGKLLSSRQAALEQAAQALRVGSILALKGLGGFHLLVAAHLDHDVDRLRTLKHREEKPLALMFPSLESGREFCLTDPFEERLLLSPESPIVLLRRRTSMGETSPNLHGPSISPQVAPNNPNLGIMLPYTPLHHLLLAQLGFPVVATSGNLSDEPICIDEHEAVRRLGGIADLFLVHNRPIVRHVDDSIVRIIHGRESVLRRARGYAPLPIPLKNPVRPTLAVGAHLKNCVALAMDRQVFISQHIGDLETAEAMDAFRRVISDLQQLYQAMPLGVAADAHPDYLSTRFARESGLPLLTVQHHFAHVLACMAENELDPPVFGVSWDGTGYGLDGSVWGGEFLLVTANSLERLGHFRTFRLPGGETAIREPRRVALGLLYELLGDAVFQKTDLEPIKAFSQPELTALKTMLQRGLNSPITSSAGRLFDAVASLIGLRQRLRFEGQAAMELEFSLHDPTVAGTYEFALRNDHADPSGRPFIIDWGPMIHQILAEIQHPSQPFLSSTAAARSHIAAKFHNTLVEMILAAAGRAGESRIALTGGCFQNKYLTELAIQRLQQAGFRPYWHQRVPPNDGGISLGQIVAASRSTQ